MKTAQRQRLMVWDMRYALNVEDGGFSQKLVVAGVAFWFSKDGVGVLGQLGHYLSEVSLKPPPLPPLAERVAEASTVRRKLCNKVTTFSSHSRSTDVYRSMPIVNGMDSSDTECGTWSGLLRCFGAALKVPLFENNVI